MIASQVYFRIIAMFLLILKQEIVAERTEKDSDVHIHFSFTDKQGAENQPEMMKKQTFRSAEKQGKMQNEQNSKITENREIKGVKRQNDYSKINENSDKNDVHIISSFPKKHAAVKKNRMMSDDAFSDYSDDEDGMVTVIRTKPHLHFGECSQASSL